MDISSCIVRSIGTDFTFPWFHSFIERSIFMVVNGIKTEDISVVVQGMVDKENTAKCLMSIRKILKGAEIILSTWEGANTKGLNFDKVIYNKDPGFSRDGKTDIPVNLNRQLISSKNGILASNRKYCIKIRSDIIFCSNNFLNYYNKFPEREKNFEVFTERVIFCSIFFRRYVGEVQYMITPMPFHISDWFVFGLKEDVLMLFDIPLPDERVFVNYLISHKIHTARQLQFKASIQYAPEQYIFLNCIKKKLKLPRFDNIIDFTSENIEFSNRVVANNCIILNPPQMKIYCAKNSPMPYCTWSKSNLHLPQYIWEGLYRYDIFVNEYKKYCNPNYVIPQEAITTKKSYMKWHKFFEKIPKDKK